jgi:formamidopyrimidine-DNA glycosylase
VPELPEVETIRSRLAPAMAGRCLMRVAILDSRLTRPEPPHSIAGELRGQHVSDVSRRGKYLVVRFESGLHLLVHLRMTGTLLHVPHGARSVDPYRRAVVTLDDGSDVVYRDVRRFGTWQLVRKEELDAFWSGRLGPEPLGPAFTSARLADALSGRRAPIKSVVLDQRMVAGLGNIYADEALWRARLHPLRAAGTLAPEEVARLLRAVRSSLSAGIERQGATLRDYRDPTGAPGRMQEALRVYGRTGEPCPRCGTPIEKIHVGGRGTWYCPRCQKPGS